MFKKLSRDMKDIKKNQSELPKMKNYNIKHEKEKKKTKPHICWD